MCALYLLSSRVVGGTQRHVMALGWAGRRLQSRGGFCLRYYQFTMDRLWTDERRRGGVDGPHSGVRTTSVLSSLCHQGNTEWMIHRRVFGRIKPWFLLSITSIHRSNPGISISILCCNEMTNCMPSKKVTEERGYL